MDKNEFCVVMKHYLLKGKTKMGKRYQKSVSFIGTIYKWLINLWSVHMNTNDGEHSMWSFEIIIPEIIEKNPWYGDEGQKIRSVWDWLLGISNDCVHNILQEHLEMKKISKMDAAFGYNWSEMSANWPF